MSEKTVDKELDVLKTDLLNVLDAVANSIKQKFAETRQRGEKVVDDVKDSIEGHPKTTALIGGTVIFGLGLLAAKLWHSRSRR